MKKSLIDLGRVLQKSEQKQIKGGGLGPDLNPFRGGRCTVDTSAACNNISGCAWYGCYCGPTYPHIAPC